MTSEVAPPRSAPRLVVKVVAFSFAVTACVLAAVFVVLTWQAQAWLTRAVTGGLALSHQRFASLRARRQQEHLLQAMALAENPTLKAALDTYNTERSAGTPAEQLKPTIARELDKLQHLLGVKALSVLDRRGEILASAGPLASDWASGARVESRPEDGADAAEHIAWRGRKTFLAVEVPMMLDLDVIGSFLLAEPLDDGYARELATEAGTDIVVLLQGRVVASSASGDLREAVGFAPLPDSGPVTLGGEQFVVRRLSTIDSAVVYALGSVTEPARAARQEAGWVLALSGLGSLLLAAVGSAWLARRLARPVGDLTASLATMAAARDLTKALPRSGVSRELDELADTFDTLRAALASAEARTEETYLGVIGTLANALDARDPYTAGHSTRVASFSVAIARQLGLPESEIESLRLGALLHDIGKIGVSDSVLRKPGPLTDEEYRQIQLHPTLGARILKPLRILSKQVAIVELHHEQPDGCGYPHGLRADEIPLAAAIVHVADAFDAMTSARAYRPRRPAAEAIAELVQHAGTGFDRAVVDAFVSLPVVHLTQLSLGLLDDSSSSGLSGVTPFRMRPPANSTLAALDASGPRALAG